MRTSYEPARPNSGVRSSGARLPVPVHPTQRPAAVQMGPEVGRFFQELRRAFRLTREQAAQRLATRVDIVAALEAGDVRQLPPWPETCRIIRTYAGFAHLDPRPVLNSIEVLLGADAHAGTPHRGLLPRLSEHRAYAVAVLGRGRRRAAAAAAHGWHQALHERHSRASRVLFAVAVPVALIVLLTQTSVLEAAVSQLPPSVARIVRGAQDYVTVQLAPVRDGLRWIDVADPRSRRSDKLPTAVRSD